MVKTKSWKHQSEAVEKFKDKKFGALLMEMGLGKSRTVIDIATEKFATGEIERVLLICPSPLKEQWAIQQLGEHHSGEYSAVVWESSKSRKPRAVNERKEKLWNDDGKLKWLIVNVEAFSISTFMPVFEAYVNLRSCMVIVDEATRIKNPAANRTGNIRKLGELAACRFILTGSLITGSPYDAWSPFEFLKAGYWGMTYYAFRSRYGIETTQSNPYGGKYRRKIKPVEIARIRNMNKSKPIEYISAIMGIRESDIKYILDRPNLDVPYKHLDELKQAINSTAVQVKKEDVFDIPPKVFTRITVQMGGEQKRIYNQLKKDMLAEYRGVELTVENKLVLVIRLQQVAGGFFPHNANEATPPDAIKGTAKLSALVGELEDIPNEPVIIWARFVAEIKMIGDMIKKELPDREPRVYYGAVKQETRAQIIREFQAGEIDTIIANPATAGFGLNLQRAHVAFYYSQGFSLEDRLQSEDRIHRAGQQASCTYIDMISKGTVDEGILDALKMKSSLSEYFSSHSLEEFLK